MIRLLLISAFAFATCATNAAAEDRATRASIGKNVRFDIAIGENTATAKSSVLGRAPVVGVDRSVSASYQAEDGQFGGYLARILDETGKTKAVSGAKMDGTSAATASSIDAMTRSEQAEYISGKCTKFALDYLAVGEAQSTGATVSATTYIFGFGRAGTTTKSKVSLLDCKSRELVWTVSLSTKQTSGNVASMAGTGIAGAGGTGQSDAVARALASALLSDMGWQ